MSAYETQNGYGRCGHFKENEEESYFKASKRFMLIHDKEMELCNKNVPPVSRSEVWKTYFDSMYTEDGELRFEFKK